MNREWENKQILGSIESEDLYVYTRVEEDHRRDEIFTKKSRIFLILSKIGAKNRNCWLRMF